jgi:hypothetical protein
MPISNGVRVFGTAAVLHSKAGRLMGYVASHGLATVQTVTFYDNTAANGAILHRMYVPANLPVHLKFGQQPGEMVSFSSGLTVDPGNCEVLVWAAS